jgi:uncharacterized membrane protein YfcA
VDLIEAAGVLVAGVVAGGLNAVVGSGTLVTFPVLLAFGYPAVVANASNTVGLIPGSLAAAHGYRAELAGRARLLVRMSVAAVLGGGLGAVLVLALPAAAFEVAVPVLIVLAVILVVVQPWLARALRARLPADQPDDAAPGGRHGMLLFLAVFGTGIYGGYFGAAQGVLLIGLLGVLIPDRLQRLNGIKNLLVGLVNAVAAVIFVASGKVSWAPALLIAAGSVVGGLLGARYGRLLPDKALRALIVVVALTAAVRMLVS